MPAVYSKGFQLFPGASFQQGHEALHCEAIRLASFASWPQDHPCSPIKLANGGFAYLGNGLGDCVRCCFCGFTRENWRNGEKPEEVHCALYPSCPMVVGCEYGTGALAGRNEARGGGEGGIGGQGLGARGVIARGEDEPSFPNGSRIRLRQNVPIPTLRLRNPRNVNVIPRTSSSVSPEARGQEEEEVSESAVAGSRGLQASNETGLTGFELRPFFRLETSNISQHQQNLHSQRSPIGGIHNRDNHIHVGINDEAGAASAAVSVNNNSANNDDDDDDNENNVVDLGAERLRREMGIRLRRARPQPTERSDRRGVVQGPHQESDRPTGMRDGQIVGRGGELAFEENDMNVFGRIQRTAGLANSDEPLFPTYQSMMSRREAFILHFPSDLRNLVAGLVSAGFFYTGYNDVVMCWHCGLMLHKWKTDDDPHGHHVTCRPTCRHFRFSSTEQS